jgi:hypothetical protein
LLTNTGDSTDSIDILNSGFRFDLETGDQRFVRGSQVCRDIDPVSDGWKRRALPSKSLRGEFGMRHDGSDFFGGIDLRYDYTAWRILVLE